MNTMLWLRAETKAGEHRTPLTPNDASTLLGQNFDVRVEKSSQRIFDDAEYEKAGCTLTDTGSWESAPSNAFVLGIKELPEDTFPLNHHHIYFGHAYKNQQGWDNLLSRFTRGNGTLLDLEYLTDDTGRRVAAFGYWAGFAGAALALKMWTSRQVNGAGYQLGPQYAADNKTELVNQIKRDADKFIDTENDSPKAIVVGSRGRCGRGAVALLESAGVKPTQWDLEETATGGPFPQLIEFDILVNTVLLSSPIPPFLTTAELSIPDRRLGVIADVSCDPTSPGNPLPVYDRITTFEEPVLRIVDGANPLDITAVDHLPSLLPRESSLDFSAQLLDHLIDLPKNTDIWKRCRSYFNQYSAQVREY